MKRISFTEYCAQLDFVRGSERPGDKLEGELRESAAKVLELDEITRQSLAALIQESPDCVPVLGLVVRLPRERLKRQLKHRLGTEGWVKLARESPEKIIDMFDEFFSLVRVLQRDRVRRYAYSDVLVERAGGRVTASSGQAGGRVVEDAIEVILNELQIPHVLRTRFEGRHGQTAPCDAAIPEGGSQAEIVIAAKGFDSTGSKLSDAVREVVEMTQVRLPRQRVYAVVDGVGWHGRQADLRRIYDLWVDEDLNGLYTIGMLGQLRAELSKSRFVAR